MYLFIDWFIDWLIWNITGSVILEEDLSAAEEFLFITPWKYIFTVTECKTYSYMSGNINAEVNSFVVVLLLSVYYYFHMNKTFWERAEDV